MSTARGHRRSQAYSFAMVRFCAAKSFVPAALIRLNTLYYITLRDHILRVRLTEHPFAELLSDRACAIRILLVLNILHIVPSVTAVSPTFFSVQYSVRVLIFFHLDSWELGVMLRVI